MEVPFINKYIQFGIIGGLIYAILSFSIYTIDPNLLVNIYLKPIPIMSTIFVLLYAIQFRIANSKLEDIVYRDLVQASFVTFIIIEMMADSYTFLLHNHLHEILNPNALPMDQFLEKAKIAIETPKYDLTIQEHRQAYERMVAHIEAEDHSLPLNRVVTGFVQWLIFGFGFSFLLAMFGMNRVKSLRNG